MGNEPVGSEFAEALRRMFTEQVVTVFRYQLDSWAHKMPRAFLK